MRGLRKAAAMTLAVSGTAAVLAGAAAVAVGRWLLPDDLHDTDLCKHRACRHWECVTLNHGDVAHVIPLNDVVPHTETDDCVCGPTAEAQFLFDGSNTWLYTHHSLDNREATE